MPINHASKQGISKWTTSNTVHGTEITTQGTGKQAQIT